MRKLVYILSLLAVMLPVTLWAEQTRQQDGKQQVADGLQDSVSVSLLTVTPGKMVYELYGHTAIRVREVMPGRLSDWVFNYGTFSFAQPHFVWRFVKGETDYELGVVPYALFYDTYVKEGRGIDEQLLNLSPAESRRLVDALSRNLLPENATYRYNFFYDNCTTRAIDMIERAVEGKIVWPQAEAGKTLRNIVDQYSEASPWNKLGQDLLLGAEADAPADRKAQGFAPLYAERFVEEAVVVSPDGARRRLAEPKRVLLPAQTGKTAKGLTPMWAFGILFALTIAITVYEHRKGCHYWAYDALLLLAQGLAGLAVFLLFCFSTHPTVGSNWLIILFNPLPLLYLPWYMKQASLHRPVKGLYVQALMLAATGIVGGAGLQQFPPELFLIWGTLAVRCIHGLKRRPEVKSS